MQNELSQSEKKEWEKVQREIVRYVEITLLKIEWYYGDNRAPFEYPPQFAIEKEQYVCSLKEDDPAGEAIHFCADSPISLSQKVLIYLESRFGPICGHFSNTLE